ncbi:TetR/AcrR family transcriptional regulator [Magnetovibrio blakemorei]|uniref:HTH tetR-type domain-containing protein n=1 Tax=Magnetovibrio blakemorei TaxID=28181 RepID=A0A1E5Q7N4_9PROT|nr:TetR/AcrR family transcriptional regulator [Magnetovibrio blakemorei]OEJ67166.1 hypothetical protein BEN30_10345 [Magnetovibrio blakemorei]
MGARKTAEERKDQIVETAIRLADEVGPDRLTTDMIAKAVGLTQPGIFRHFSKKEYIWQAVAVHLSGQMSKAWGKAQDAKTSPVDQLQAVVMAQLDLIQKTPALPGIIFSRELHIENKILRQAFYKIMNHFHTRLTKIIEAAIEEGQFKQDLPSEDAAFLLIGMIQSLAMRWSLSGRTIDLPTTGARLLALQLEGFAAPGATQQNGTKR